MASHNEFPSKSAEERFADLKDTHQKKPLLTFLDFSKQELKELLKELQREKNLLQEKELKQLGSSLFDWLIDFLFEITDADNKNVVKVALKEFFEEKEQKTVAISGVSGKWIES